MKYYTHNQLPLNSTRIKNYPRVGTEITRKEDMVAAFGKPDDEGMWLVKWENGAEACIAPTCIDDLWEIRSADGDAPSYVANALCRDVTGTQTRLPLP